MTIVITMLADHLWQSTLVAASLGLLTLTLRHSAARLRYAVWLCASVKFLVPFSWLIALGGQLGARALPAAPSTSAALLVSHGVQWGTLADRIAQPFAAFAPSGVSPSPASTAVTAATHVDFSALALLVWVAGTVAVLATWLARRLELAALVRRSHLLIDPMIDDIPLEARLSRSRIEPGVVGILRPILLLPNGIGARLEPAQLRAIVEHEICHVYRRDNLTAAVHMLVEALFWFHPLVWWIGARLIDERERACDEAVLATTTDPRRYADAIIKVCEFCVPSPLSCAAGIGGGGNLPGRVERLLSARTLPALGAARRCLLAVAALALLGGPIAIGFLHPAAARAQSAAPGAQSAADGAAAARFEGDPPGVWIGGPRVTVIDRPLRDLIAMAFELQRTQIVGPDTIDSRHYTIVGELPAVDYHRSDPGDQYRAYVRSLLEERFGLVSHREIAVVPALSLVSGAWRPGLAPADEHDPVRWFGRGPPPCSPNGECVDRPSPPNVIIGRNASIDMMAHFLSEIFGLPVLDRTSLTGHYDFTLDWPIELAQPDRQGLPSNDVLRNVLDEQLGLKLLAGDSPVERLVVDRISEPSDIPQASSSAGVDPPATILRNAVGSITSGATLEIVLDRHGAMYLRHGDDLDPVQDPQSVIAIAADAVGRDPDLTARVSADGLIANHRVVEAASLLASAGVTRIVFATLPFRPNTVLDDARSLNRKR